MRFKDIPNSANSTLSPEAVRSRNTYYQKWRSDHPQDSKVIQCRYWEKKAKALYGPYYVGSDAEDVLSQQAREVRRKYYADYSKKNADAIRKNNKDFWEKKGRNDNEGKEV